MRCWLAAKLAFAAENSHHCLGEDALSSLEAAVEPLRLAVASATADITPLPDFCFWRKLRVKHKITDSGLMFLQGDGSTVGAAQNLSSNSAGVSMTLNKGLCPFPL